MQLSTMVVAVPALSKMSQSLLTPFTPSVIFMKQKPTPSSMHLVSRYHQALSTHIVTTAVD
ncbi:MAG: hypothetical protein WDO15_05915 [Bacteroidota bacterium]